MDKDEEAASARGHRHASGDPEKQDKGKQRADDPPNTVSGGGKSIPVSHSRSRRPRGRRPPVSVLRPILPCLAAASPSQSPIRAPDVLAAGIPP